MLAKGPESGYSIIQKIDERTEGAWRPGPGTMYPLLKSLLKEGLVKPTGESGGAGTKTYALTHRGRGEIDKTRQLFAGAGRKEPVMARLFSDILPGAVFAPLVVRRFRDNAETFRKKLEEVPEPERTALLQELRFLLDSQIQWIDSKLLKGPIPKPR